MSNNTATPILDTDPAVSLSLQSLIDARFDVPYPSQSNVQGLSPLNGQIKGRRRGQGLEFEDLRSYTHGDDVRHIDWKVSARHNQLYTRLYREEKEQLVTLVLDFTSPMFTGSTELRAVQAGRVAANLAWHEVSAGGRCGLMIQTDNEFIAQRPALGDRAALSICAEIVKQFERAKSQSTQDNKNGPANRNILDRLRATGRESGALIILTGLDNTKKPFQQHLQELAIEKQIAMVSIEDPLEYSALPEGTFRYTSNNKPVSISLSRKQVDELVKQLHDQHQQLEQMLLHAQVPLLRSRDGINNIRATLHQMGFLA